jgi:hypothetical protein
LRIYPKRFWLELFDNAAKAQGRKRVLIQALFLFGYLLRIYLYIIVIKAVIGFFSVSRHQISKDIESHCKTAHPGIIYMNIEPLIIVFIFCCQSIDTLESKVPGVRSRIWQLIGWGRTFPLNRGSSNSPLLSEFPVQVRFMNGDNVTLTVYSHDTVVVLRDLLQGHLSRQGHEGTPLRLIVGTTILQDSRTLLESNIEENAVITAAFLTEALNDPVLERPVGLHEDEREGCPISVVATCTMFLLFAFFERLLIRYVEAVVGDCADLALGATQANITFFAPRGRTYLKSYFFAPRG